MARSPIFSVLALLTACATVGPGRGPLGPGDLLSGTALGLAVDLPAPISPADAFALDDGMRAFVAEQVGDAGAPGARLHRLLSGMERRGLFSLQYDETSTRTARETFYARKGNCLSFTMLFVALARESGLDVSYQIVDVPPTWSNESELVVIGNHVNVLVESSFGGDYVVDFNQKDYHGRYDAHRVDDRYVLALFYNNMGAEALILRSYELAFRYLREAIVTQAALPDAWTNLGLLFSRLGRFAHAEAAYREALAVSPDNPTALTNLASLHASLGDEETAAIYRQRIRHYQQRNPYYHFAIAQRAYDDHRPDDALAALKQAVRLKRDEQEFYFLQGLAYRELGELASAEASFTRSRNYADSDAARARCDAQLQALARLGAPPRAAIR